MTTNDVEGDRVLRWCWLNFHYLGVLLVWVVVGQGPTALAVGAGWGCWDIFSLIYNRLKYYLIGPLSPKQLTNQPINDVPLSIYKRKSF